MRAMLRIFGVILSMAFISLSTGCSSSNKSAFQPVLNVELHLEATKDINVFDDGSARTVVVRIYQLTDLGNFSKASFTELYNNDQAVLAGALIASDTLSPVLPGEQRKLTLDVQQQAKFLAVFVEFSNYETAMAKSTVALVEEPENYPVYIVITQDKVDISQPINESWWTF